MHINSRRYSWIKTVIVAISIAVGAGIAHYHYSAREQGPIYTFQEKRDLEDMNALFVKDWYCLSNREYARENIDFALKTHSPNEYEPRYFGKMHIKVLREQGKLVGFVTYYMVNFYEGKVLFLAVNPEYRGKRYGEKLLRYAVDDLFSNGATVVRLVTRTANFSAQKLYKRFGFQVTNPDDEGFMHFAIHKK